jgi:3-oxoacyl-[acyl-carrier-protein] synthase II
MSVANGKTRVVITGIGAITPIGLGIEEFWRGLLAGKSGIDRVTLFDSAPYRTRIAGEVKNFDPKKYIDPK